VRQGNAYPALSQAQLDMIRNRRNSSNCSTNVSAMTKALDGHQSKHIMLCAGAGCKASCNSCGTCGVQTGQRSWEYLSKRLQVRQSNLLAAVVMPYTALIPPAFLQAY
jgi:hypothetical protein